MELLSFYINCVVIFILVFQGFRDDSRTKASEMRGLFRYRDLTNTEQTEDESDVYRGGQV